jgi:hypothetical protein
MLIIMFACQLFRLQESDRLCNVSHFPITRNEAIQITVIALYLSNGSYYILIHPTPSSCYIHFTPAILITGIADGLRYILPNKKFREIIYIIHIIFRDHQFPFLYS